MLRHQPIHLPQFRRRVQAIFQSNYPGFRIGRQFEPGRQSAGRIDGYQRAQIIFLLSEEKYRRETGGAVQGVCDHRRIVKGDIAVGQTEFIRWIFGNRAFDQRNPLVFRRHVH